MSATPYLSHPFFYIIRDKRNGMLYAGSKWSKRDSYPELFMTEDGYQTSSITIHNLIKKYGLETFEVVKIRKMDDPYTYETRFLERVDAENNSKFYNAHNNKLACPGSEQFEKLMLDKYGVTNANYIPEVKERASKKISETMMSEEWKSTVGKASAESRAKTISDPNWIAEVGIPAAKCRANTVSDPEWKNSVGQHAYASRSNSLSSIRECGKTGFELMEEKRQQTISDPKWAETIGKAGFEKISKAKKGGKKLIRGSAYKVAIPNSQRWKQLIEEGWTPKA